MGKHRIIAIHPALGTVVFVVEAEDKAKAFSVWKQIVYSSRQWNVKSNEETQ